MLLLLPAIINIIIFIVSWSGST